jgi:hypothetical protein
MIRKLSFAACVGALALAGAAHAAETGTSYGKGVSLATATPLADLAARPQDFLGKTVRVEGVVTAVCEKRGCWMQIDDPKAGKGMRLKVDDGVIVFPMSAMGHKASAEGVVEAIVVSEAQAAEMAKEHAHEGGAADRTPKPGTLYQIRGTGAIVY